MKAMRVQVEHARYELLTLPILLAGCTTWSVEVIFSASGAASGGPDSRSVDRYRHKRAQYERFQ
jgi:hypothetical protein